MNAAIIFMPRAAGAPVQAQKLSQGRPPKNVTSIRQGSWTRARIQGRQDRASMLEADARRYRKTAADMADTIDFALSEAALLEQEARRLRGKRTPWGAT